MSQKIKGKVYIVLLLFTGLIFILSIRGMSRLLKTGTLNTLEPQELSSIEYTNLAVGTVVEQEIEQIETDGNKYKRVYLNNIKIILSNLNKESRKSNLHILFGRNNIVLREIEYSLEDVVENEWITIPIKKAMDAGPYYIKIFMDDWEGR